MKITIMILTALIFAAAPIGGAIFLDFQEQENGVMTPKDTTPPTSTIDSPMFYLIPSLYDGIVALGFQVTWEGIDNEGGVGIDYYDVQYRTFPSNCYESYNGELSGVPLFPNWHDLVTNTTDTSVFVGVHHEMIYEFRVRAVDKNDNEEAWSILAGTRTAVVTVPVNIYRALMIAQYIIEEVEENIWERIPDDTAPISRVLPLPPLAVPQPIMTIQGSIIVHPDIELDINKFAPTDDPFGYWTYDTIPVEWRGRDLKGTEELCFDVQYRRTYMETDIVKIPEARIDPRALPASTGWVDWLEDTSSNEGSFEILGPGLYEFRCRATDIFGNVEEYPLTADASTYVLPLI
jgi:hypothetical protein